MIRKRKQRININEKTLHRFIKTNIGSILTRDHEDAKAMIRNAGKKSHHVPMDMAARTIRQVLVVKIGDKII